jgi:hypothetical protein
MDLFLDPLYQGNTNSETSMAMWLVAGWWPEVKSIWSDKELPESWRPLFHDIFGDAFRPVVFDPRWRTSDVVGLARAIYDDKAFERMPTLADALLDAGCDEEQVISHCRSDGPHVGGCWAVDLILGKA